MLRKTANAQSAPPRIGSADGCKGGWVLALGERWPCTQPPRLHLCADFRRVLALARSCSAVVVDMPIGLPSDVRPRACDELARQELGSCRSRVFRAPPRQALRARTVREFQEIHRRICGVGAGYPVWNIAAKMREVDAAMSPPLQQRVVEFHPELVWKRLAGKALPSKHGKAGLRARLSILRRFVPGMAAALRWRERFAGSVDLDDVLDAVVGLAAAHAVSRARRGSTARGSPADSDISGRAGRLPPERPPRDARGLRMEIWF
jgi:predicted RNase H-like nuclease